jgi:periplasmic divalent cation tolerance protein
VTGAPDPRPTPAGSIPAAASPLAVLVTTTVPSQADATRIAETTVAECLVACAQVQGPVQSTFRWQGRVDRATEWYVHCKTAASRVPELIARLKALHPYDVPEIVATPVVAGYAPYLQWIEQTVRGEQ